MLIHGFSSWIESHYKQPQTVLQLNLPLTTKRFVTNPSKINPSGVASNPSATPASSLCSRGCLIKGHMSNSTRSQPQTCQILQTSSQQTCLVHTLRTLASTWLVQGSQFTAYYRTKKNQYPNEQLSNKDEKRMCM